MAVSPSAPLLPSHSRLVPVHLCATHPRCPHVSCLHVHPCSAPAMVWPWRNPSCHVLGE